jgi:hypothetical protein
MSTNNESVQYHGFTLEITLAQAGTNVRGWLTRVLDRNGADVQGFPRGPWISRREARDQAEMAALKAIKTLGELEPNDSPGWAH